MESNHNESSQPAIVTKPMKLTCTHCGYVASSLLLEQEKALAEVSTLFSKHIAERHPDKNKQIFLDCAMVQQLVPWIIFIAKHSTFLDLPAEVVMDHPIMARFDDAIQRLEDCLGVEVMDIKPDNPTDEGNISVGEVNPSTEQV